MSDSNWTVLIWSKLYVINNTLQLQITGALETQDQVKNRDDNGAVVREHLPLGGW